MKTSDKIKAPIAKDLEEFNKGFAKSMKSNIPLLNIVINYLLRRKGKQIRPVLVFLSAKLLGEINPSTHTAASLIELLHTATLVHDDVVDDAHERRGFLSINAIWRSKIAVLLGDYLLSRGLLLALKRKEYDILEIATGAVEEMISGELLQIQKTRKLNLTEEEYFKIITKKTATLLAVCTATGARSVVEDKSVIAKMSEFGLNIGIAFQIKDDLFDYDPNSKTGKPKGNDIQEKKLTLPLIYALGKASGKESKKIISLINKKSANKKTFTEVYNFVHEYKGVEYAHDKMNYYKNSALGYLSEFPDSQTKTSLIDLINYIVERKK